MQVRSLICDENFDVNMNKLSINYNLNSENAWFQNLEGGG